VGATDTKNQILDAAERLFAERGFDATSLRTITSEAGVNLAAIHYHFGSKEALIEALLFRRLDAINRERLQLLDACEAQSGSDAPDLHCLIHSFVAPALRYIHDPLHGGRFFVRIMAQAYTYRGDFLHRVFKERFGPFLQRYLAAFSGALADEPMEEVAWKFFFMVGTMAHTLGGMHKLDAMTDGVCDTSDAAAITERLVNFTAAGMRAAGSNRHG
jgi:AcrR family transcriptional regulator